MNASLHRRATASARLRENRPQSSNAAGGVPAPTGRKSHSPEGRNDDATTRTRLPRLLKQKRTVSQLDNAASSRPSSMALAEDERGRRNKSSKHRTQPPPESEPRVSQDKPTGRRPGKTRRKERSPSHEDAGSPSRARRAASPDADSMDIVEDRLGSGSLAAVDYMRIRDELEGLRKLHASAKKVIHSQIKTIDELKKDLASAHKSHNEERHQVARLKAEAKKNTEIVTAVESNLSCQICMELLMKPYGLSPCGHVLCLGCLQGWFRTPPTGEEDMEEDDPDVILYRKKSCPVCRAEVFHRPIPLFVIKSIASAFDKVKQGSPRRSSPLPDGDPWAGIFPEAVSPYNQHDSDSESNPYYDFDDETDQDYGDSEDEMWPLYGYGSDSDGGFYDGEYVHPRWAPPTVDVSPDDFPFEDINNETLSMLRRGATLQMIALFSMTYTHDEGLMAYLEENEVYLGWNISLKQDDATGEEYMDWIEADIVNHSERWEKQDSDDNWTAWRLIREEEEEDFELTDSEMWAEELADLHDGL